jgi:hypothetical protein
VLLLSFHIHLLLLSSHIHLLLVFPLVEKVILFWLVLPDVTRAPQMLGAPSEESIIVVLLAKIIVRAIKVLEVRLSLNYAAVPSIKGLKIKWGLVLRQIFQVHLVELILHLAHGLVVHWLAHGFDLGLLCLLNGRLLHLLHGRRFLLHTKFST